MCFFTVEHRKKCSLSYLDRDNTRYQEVLESVFLKLSKSKERVREDLLLKESSKGLRGMFRSPPSTVGPDKKSCNLLRILQIKLASLELGK